MAWSLSKAMAFSKPVVGGAHGGYTGLRRGWGHRLLDALRRQWKRWQEPRTPPVGRALCDLQMGRRGFDRVRRRTSSSTSGRGSVPWSRSSRGLTAMDRSVKVLHVIPSVGPLRGGPSVTMRLMARGLARAGCEVHVATTDDDGPGRLEVPLGVPVVDDGVTYRHFRRQTRFYGVLVAADPVARPARPGLRPRPRARALLLRHAAGGVLRPAGPRALRDPATRHPEPLGYRPPPPVAQAAVLRDGGAPHPRRGRPDPLHERAGADRGRGARASGSGAS